MEDQCANSTCFPLNSSRAAVEGVIVIPEVSWGACLSKPHLKPILARRGLQTSRNVFHLARTCLTPRLTILPPCLDDLLSAYRRFSAGEPLSGTPAQPRSDPRNSEPTTQAIPCIIAPNKVPPKSCDLSHSPRWELPGRGVWTLGFWLGTSSVLVASAHLGPVWSLVSSLPSPRWSGQDEAPGGSSLGLCGKAVEPSVQTQIGSWYVPERQ